ncbi:hypothetical protein [Streptomyces mangrovisoli]|uniref:hypothetical protein n=1 Tax=Streptomyces mangrovisoli TaxID=1428628 RepID=UPI000B31262B|nr:hypothetical protein [Streptomyces mangrovisoli]
MRAFGRARSTPGGRTAAVSDPAAGTGPAPVPYTTCPGPGRTTVRGATARITRGREAGVSAGPARSAVRQAMA